MTRNPAATRAGRPWMPLSRGILATATTHSETPPVIRAGNPAGGASDRLEGVGWCISSYVASLAHQFASRRVLTMGKRGPQPRSFDPELVDLVRSAYDAGVTIKSLRWLMPEGQRLGTLLLNHGFPPRDHRRLFRASVVEIVRTMLESGATAVEIQAALPPGIKVETVMQNHDLRRPVRVVGPSIQREPRQPGWNSRDLHYGDIQHIEARFWTHVDTSNADGCWTWTASVGSGGYGQFAIKPRVLRVHRVGFVLQTRSSLVSELTVDHLCYRRLCVRASHLEAVSLEENLRRMRAPQATEECLVTAQAPARDGETRPTRTSESVVVHARRGNVSMNRYWWRMDDGHHELRFDVEDITRPRDEAPFVCLNLTRRQARDLRDALSEVLRKTGATR